MNVPRDCRAFRLVQEPTQSSCAVPPVSMCARPGTQGTHQNDLGLVQLFLHLHDRVRLLGILVLCEIVCEGALELALLGGGQAAGSGLGGVAAERIGGGGAERGGGGLVGETGEEGGVLVEDLGEEGECGPERVLEVGDHDGCGVSATLWTARGRTGKARAAGGAAGGDKDMGLVVVLLDGRRLVRRRPLGDGLG